MQKKEELKEKKWIFGVFGAAFLCLVGIGIVTGQNNGIQEAIPVIATGNWGLSFQEEGKAPVIDVDAEKLNSLGGYYLGDESKKKIYLTFDAGYENGNTEAILDALKKHNVKAAFFLVGNYLETCPDLVKRMVEEGHLVCNHTYHHKDMSTLESQDEFLKELQDLESLYKEIIGTDMPKFYRPPQGKFCEEHLNWAKEKGYKTIFWSLAYVDWDEKKQPSKESAIEKLTQRVHPGAIVLLHSTSSTNGLIMDEILTKWEEMGYSFGELTEL